jgi:hypothetical protein
VGRADRASVRESVGCSDVCGVLRSVGVSDSGKTSSKDRDTAKRMFWWQLFDGTGAQQTMEAV